MYCRFISQALSTLDKVNLQIFDFNPQPNANRPVDIDNQVNKNTET